MRSTSRRPDSRNASSGSSGSASSGRCTARWTGGACRYGALSTASRRTRPGCRPARPRPRTPPQSWPATSTCSSPSASSSATSCATSAGTSYGPPYVEPPRPGRSGASTRRPSASAGATSRQHDDVSGTPCSSSSGTPVAPAVLAQQEDGVGRHDGARLVHGVSSFHPGAVPASRQATARRSGVEQPLDDGACPARDAAVLVEELALRARRVARGSGRPRRARGRSTAARRPACRGRGRARCASGPPWSRRRRRTSASSSPPAPRRPRRQRRRVLVVRRPGSSAACRSWSSWTVHSTSARPPRPSLRARPGSTPRGIRSFSTRALMRRTSTTCASVRPPSGQRTGATISRKRAARSASPASGAARSRACASQTSDQRA